MSKKDEDKKSPKMPEYWNPIHAQTNYKPSKWSYNNFHKEGAEDIPSCDEDGNFLTCNGRFIPEAEARAILADRERLKLVESKLKIAIEVLESVEGFDGSDDILIANAIKQIGKVDK